jgi:23S rRNA (adenine2503-C2)-methyltransferase
MPKNKNIYDLTYDDLVSLVAAWGEPNYRATQIWKGLYQQLIISPDEFTTLPKDLRNKLSEYFAIRIGKTNTTTTFTQLNPTKLVESKDGETIKTLFTFYGGKQVEAVLMRYRNRQTLCVSTQSGCAMGCVFCATGQMGFHHQLTSGEIIEQILFYARQLALKHEQVTNVVLMGMGEPFNNYNQTMAAISRLTHPQGFNLGSRRFTISTVGIVPGIQRFTQEHSQVNLAISLHAADDNLRSQLLPINRKYPLDQLFSACLEYVQITHRRLSFEWALIQGVNDQPAQAQELIHRLHPFRVSGSVLCHVNLLQLNPINNFLGIASTRQRAIAFQDILEHAGIPCTIRLRRGIEIQAGCGQLYSKT